MKSTLYEQSTEIRAFLQEKLYLQNVSSRTIVLYESCFKAFAGALEPDQLTGRVVELRQRGLSPVTVNTYLRHIKCYYLWQKREWKLPWLKEEQKLLSVLTEDAIRKVADVKLHGQNLVRARLVALTILDTGLRASEVLGLTKEELDFDNLVIKVRGKGGKHRLIPFSQELRKSLYRHTKNPNDISLSSRYVFGTKTNNKVSVRNLERDFKVLGEKIGVSLRPHNLRHTFAVSYLRLGGNLEYLRRILGHSTLATTQKYLRGLGVEDLQAVHSQHSPLSNLRR